LVKFEEQIARLLPKVNKPPSSIVRSKLRIPSPAVKN
jgi:hypothetical protein